MGEVAVKHSIEVILGLRHFWCMDGAPVVEVLQESGVRDAPKAMGIVLAGVSTCLVCGGE